MSDFRNTRPDSPKGKVFSLFQKKGEKAARKLGETLEISASRLNRWFKDNGAGFQASNDQAKARKDKEPEKKNGKAPAKKAAAKKVVPVKKAAKPATKPKAKSPGRPRKSVQEPEQAAA